MLQQRLPALCRRGHKPDGDPKPTPTPTLTPNRNPNQTSAWRRAWRCATTRSPACRSSTSTCTRATPAVLPGRAARRPSHCAGNFFSEKQSDLDVVPPGAGDDEYRAAVHLLPLFERVQPDLTFFQVVAAVVVPFTFFQVGGGGGGGGSSGSSGSTSSSSSSSEPRPPRTTPLTLTLTLTLTLPYPNPTPNPRSGGRRPARGRRAGKLRLTSVGLGRRNKLVYEQAAAHATRLPSSPWGEATQEPERLDPRRLRPRGRPVRGAVPHGRVYGGGGECTSMVTRACGFIPHIVWVTGLAASRAP